MTPNDHRPHRPRPVSRRAVLAAGVVAATAGLVLTGSGVAIAQPAPIRVAVASGFAPAARQIARRFTAQTGQPVTFEVAASGKLYAQIVGGSGVHVFLSADAERPARAEAAGLTAPDSRFTYALGRLVLWSPDPALIDGTGAILNRPDALPSLAIANPVTSRHGAAAVEVLETLGLYGRLRPVTVTAADSLAVLDILTDGDAAAGFVPQSLVAKSDAGSRWLVPGDLHAPIRHQAVLMASGMRNAAARAFLSFLREPPAREIMAEYGYEPPTLPLR
ncbi:molybdate ABC transporter substrate-binding protein [Roseospira marina]|uniref:Molybdate ABC transporter substrate-binding protein n=1 Tax=Roseospira marina TaxID=140057 RepID=A0A5M6IFB8_9PROT|nr:molybdate ABC transporter substrate-binding protein [Roseospira marina]KAA5606637.1 molybdate ABC transporter substrate-binding protein [Roseospira marina]MBB4313958.1 molybdate transport system substrate-binding protein [Roseospira marina]MBB5087120.1 molybdate transport system substrate-binding protein [Roseospira marina]